VNEYEGFAGLTNKRIAKDRNENKRSRGELPLLLVRSRSIVEAVDSFHQTVKSKIYNPAWLIAGDRSNLFYIEVGDEDRPIITELRPGIHILENAPIGVETPKAVHIKSKIETGQTSLWTELPSLLSDHEVPAGAFGDQFAGDVPRRLETYQACVHLEDYGTRSSTMIRFGANSEEVPEVLVSPGHPCTDKYIDMSSLLVRN
jgi:uncharacterized protein with NRDE domain